MFAGNAWTAVLLHLHCAGLSSHLAAAAHLVHRLARRGRKAGGGGARWTPALHRPLRPTTKAHIPKVGIALDLMTKYLPTARLGVGWLELSAGY